MGFQTTSKCALKHGRNVGKRVWYDHIRTSGMLKANGLSGYGIFPACRHSAQPINNCLTDHIGQWTRATGALIHPTGHYKRHTCIVCGCSHFWVPAASSWLVGRPCCFLVLARFQVLPSLLFLRFMVCSAVAIWLEWTQGRDGSIPIGCAPGEKNHATYTRATHGADLPFSLSRHLLSLSRMPPNERGKAYRVKVMWFLGCVYFFH